LSTAKTKEQSEELKRNISKPKKKQTKKQQGKLWVLEVEVRVKRKE